MVGFSPNCIECLRSTLVDQECADMAQAASASQLTRSGQTTAGGTNPAPLVISSGPPNLSISRNTVRREEAFRRGFSLCLSV